MNNTNVDSYVLADYKIENIFVDICFTSGLVEAFYTKKNLMAYMRSGSFFKFNAMFRFTPPLGGER